jgi:DNA-binding NarL/FixJ family response regulator
VKKTSPSITIIRAILVDDHAVVRAGIRQFLEQFGEIKIIAEAEDGLEACKLIENLHPDVAVLDIQMPKMNGIEVTQWIRSRNLAVGILILTAYDDTPYIKAILRAGANGYVLKTADPNEIINSVRDVFNGKLVLDSTLSKKFIGMLTPQKDELPIKSLTRRELDVLELVGKGLTNKSIGIQLSISDRTVQNHLAHIFSKLQAGSRTDAVMRGIKRGLITVDIPDKQIK